MCKCSYIDVIDHTGRLLDPRPASDDTNEAGIRPPAAIPPKPAQLPSADGDSRQDVLILSEDLLAGTGFAPSLNIIIVGSLINIILMEIYIYSSSLKSCKIYSVQNNKYNMQYIFVCTIIVYPLYARVVRGRQFNFPGERRGGGKKTVQDS